MITNSRELLSLMRDQGTILGLDLVCGTSFGIEPSRNDDAVTVNIMLVRFVATILEGDRDFRGSGTCELGSETSKEVREYDLRFSLFNKTL